MEEPSSGGIKSALLVVMYLGAANQDADRIQRCRMKEEVLPLMKDDALTPKEAYVAAVQQTKVIMGPEWEPEGEYREFLDSLLEEEDA